MGYQKLTKSFFQQVGSAGKPGNINSTLIVILTENASDRIASFVALGWSDSLDERSDSPDDDSSSLLVSTLFFTGTTLLDGVVLFGDFGLSVAFKKSRMHLQSYKYCSTFCKPSSEIFLGTWTWHQQTYFTNYKVSSLICCHICSSWWILLHSEKEKKLVGGKNPERNSIVWTVAQTLG